MSQFNPEAAHAEIAGLLNSKYASLQKQLDQLHGQLNRPDPGDMGNGGFKSLASRVFEAKLGDALRLSKRASLPLAGEFDIFGRARFPEAKATISSGTLGSSTPGILVPQRVDEIVKPPQRAVRVRDLIPRASTANNAVEYIQENVFTNAASPVTESASKQPSDDTFVIQSANVRCIAHWFSVSRQALDDLPSLEGFLNTRLIDGILDIEDWELLFGDNTGQHLNGLYTQATAYAGTYATAGDTRIDVLAHCLQELESENYRPDMIVLNPVDWRYLTLQKTEEVAANRGQYQLGSPAATADPRLWGVPIALTTAMRVGAYLVGQATGSAMIFDRMEARVDLSQEHDSYFVLNLVAIRGEERITLACFRPAAFRRGTFA